MWGVQCAVNGSKPSLRWLKQQSIVKDDTVPDIFRVYNLNHAPVILYVSYDLQDTKKIVPKLTMNLANLVSDLRQW